MKRITGILLTVLVSVGLVSPVAGHGTLLSLSAKDCSYGGEIKSIAAVDAMTVKFTLCYPDPAFTAKVVQDAFGIQSADYLQKKGGTGDLLSKPIGTGPYKLGKGEAGNEKALHRFE